MKYYVQTDGEWVKPIMKGHKLGCCDCGLVHIMDYKIVGKRVIFRATRDSRATAGRRRKKHKCRLYRGKIVKT